MPPPIVPVPEGQPTFCGFPRCDDLDHLDADIAVLGVAYGTPYGDDSTLPLTSAAPQAIREHSQRWSRYVAHYDFDLGGDLFAGRPVHVADVGDVALTPGFHDENFRITTEAVQRILAAGSVPFVIGGDHSIPIPVMRAYDGSDGFCVVQIDAHLDWRDEVGGVRHGLSSPMRRASELSFVTGMAQLGIRGVGSGRAEDVAAAREYGSIVIGAAEIHRQGTTSAIARIPDADRYYITFDVDGMDPAIAPGVGYPAFGGLDYDEAFELLNGVAARGAVVGFDLVEVVPALDVRNLTSLVSARLMLNLIGAMARSGQIGNG